MEAQYQCTVPVLFLIFNRPEHAAKSFERIRSVRPPRLYVHADGPRDTRPGEAAQTAATRAVIAGVDWPCEVFTLFRDKNRGLREGVYGALQWFFEAEAMGIVIEDDCVPDPSFFPFCAELLGKYADDDRVMHIGGSNLIERFTDSATQDYFWTRFSLVWGWASWRRAWAKMDMHLQDLDHYEQKGLIRDFLPLRPAQAYMLDKFRVTHDKKNQSWAYAWFYSILRHQGWCIVPCRNLIENVGVGDAGATNTRYADKKSQIAARSMDFPLRHPSAQPQIRPEWELQLFYHTQKARLRLWIWYFLRYLPRQK